MAGEGQRNKSGQTLGLSWGAQGSQTLELSLGCRAISSRGSAWVQGGQTLALSWGAGLSAPGAQPVVQGGQTPGCSLGCRVVRPQGSAGAQGGQTPGLSWGAGQPAPGAGAGGRWPPEDPQLLCSPRPPQPQGKAPLAAAPLWPHNTPGDGPSPPRRCQSHRDSDTRGSTPAPGRRLPPDGRRTATQSGREPQPRSAAPTLVQATASWAPRPRLWAPLQLRRCWPGAPAPPSCRLSGLSTPAPAAGATAVSPQDVPSGIPDCRWPAGGGGPGRCRGGRAWAGGRPRAWAGGRPGLGRAPLGAARRARPEVLHGPGPLLSAPGSRHR